MFLFCSNRLRSFVLRSIFLLFLIGLAPTWASTVYKPAPPPSVIVTIKPIFGLVSALMQGVTKPTLLTENRGSAHSLALSARDIAVITKADLVVWVGPSYEFVMAKALKAALPKDHLITLEETPHLTLLPKRYGKLFPGCGHDHSKDPEITQNTPHLSHDHHHGIDGHFWLDIHNAKLCVKEIAKRLKEKWPEFQTIFAANEIALLIKLDALNKELHMQLKPLAGMIALVDHDSLHYLEKRFRFTIRGVLSDDEGMAPSLQHFKALTDELDANIEEKLIQVFFYTGTNSAPLPPLIKKLTSLYSIPAVPLDYASDAVPACDNPTTLYERTLKNLATQLLKMRAIQP